MKICWTRCKTGWDVQQLLEELHSAYTQVKILGITDSDRGFSIFYKLDSKEREEKIKMAKSLSKLEKHLKKLK